TVFQRKETDCAMMDRLNLYRPLYLVLLLVSGIAVASSYFVDKGYFYTWSFVWIICAVAVLVKGYWISRDNKRFFDCIREAVFGVQKDALTSFPMATAIARGNGEIIWLNDQFSNSVVGDGQLMGTSVFDLLPDIDFKQNTFADGYSVIVGQRQYTAYIVRSDQHAEQVFMIYMIDDNDLKNYTREYFDSRPSVLLMVIDNYAELFTDSKENERSKLMGEIEHIIENFAEENQGLLRKLDKDRYVAVIEERHMKNIISKRFDVLDKIRTVVTGDRIPVTMSIGVGSKEGDLHDSEAMARQALDMALGRGGDQAAVKLRSGYEFYGGVSKGVEKRNKVRTRIVANAISEVVATSNNILIMGHRFSDLDCLGSAIGICAGLKQCGKPVNIVLNTETTLAQPLYEKMLDEGYGELIVSPENAMPLAGKDTLLIIVDTHVKTLVESQEVYNACKNIVVIDHHRKMVNHIDNAIIFFHEPYASSASEMAAELVQYLSDRPKITVGEAESMLAGIMLDTKSFTIRTGVRTFEAAAFLRKMGADTIEVRKLFSSSMETYQQRSRLVSSAEIYRGCAISYTEAAAAVEDIRIVSAQAADELLTISDVEASFVLYEYTGGTAISARSMGDLNVQVIMEMLGGGGHMTMAAVQLAEVSMEDARQRLLTAIDSYLAGRPKTD
ncbi:MAG: DHH family phosphoesterase, partial [Angelakisella sp.]